MKVIVFHKWGGGGSWKKSESLTGIEHIPYKNRSHTQSIEPTRPIGSMDWASNQSSGGIGKISVVDSDLFL